MIDELEITNFRGFSHLELKGLKRVNLVVGENNAGKTSLLEAILILCEPEKAAHLPSMFRAVQGNSDKRYFPWLLKDRAADGQGFVFAKAGAQGWKIYFGASPPGQFAFASYKEFYKGPGTKFWSNDQTISSRSCRVISVHHCNPDDLVKLVGKAHRKANGEETLQRLLAKVDPRLKKVRIDPGDNPPTGDGNQVIVDIGLSELAPVSQAGQGVYRLLSILADIIGEKPEVVLIDEVENGLHHSVHKQVWAGLAETAEKLDVQIIATTHSGECLDAAHNAFLERKDYDFSVIQLFRVEKGAQGRVLDREHIEAAIAGKINLR